MKPGRARAWLAALAGAAAAALWLGAAAAQEFTLGWQQFLDDGKASPALAERALDALVLIPLILLSALAALGARRLTPPRGPDSRRPLFPALLPALAGLALAALFLGARDFLLYRFAAVEEGTLYRSGQLGLSVLEGRARRLGLKTIAFLREPGPEGEGERALARRLGIRFVHIPMEDPARGTAAFLALLDDPSARPVLIHCRYGVARTGVLAAVFRMEYQGWTSARALAEARLFALWGGLDADGGKAAFLRAYRPRRAPPAPPGEKRP